MAGFLVVIFVATVPAFIAGMVVGVKHCLALEGLTERFADAYELVRYGRRNSDG